MNKILYLEDDINLSDTISEFLHENGFDVTCVYDSHETLNSLFEKKFDLLILDVNIARESKESGFHILKDLRKSDINIPTIFTTSLNSIDDLEKGYKLGCDDYLKKPFALKELLHRINTIIKRGFNTQNKILHISHNTIFDITNDTLIVDNIPISLKNKELLLLKLLLRYKNQLVTFDTIYQTVWSYSESSSDMSLRTYIKALRKFLGNEKIISIKKQGYKFVV